MYLDAACMDMEEALRTLQLVSASYSAERIGGQHDMSMWVRGQKQGEIPGETIRRYDGEAPHHPILGYYMSAGSPTDSASGQATGRRRYSAVRVVRSADSSTAKLMSAFASNEDLEVALHNWRRWGHNDETEFSSLKVVLEKARLKTFTIMGGGALPHTGNLEIFELTFRSIEIQTTGQSTGGAPKAANTFEYTLE